ncbi:FAD dependent oxidoreductase-like protein [Phyllosticta capitalensis]|uniref:FAD dependent oxidoreductase-like protein n=1 Tax=Phyllosticta capitalensis TaxID=121624 RepID=A0ABR1YIM7_9PEZI
MASTSSSSNPDPSSSSHRPAGLPVPNSTKSFWHSEPNQFLLGHRTTEDLPAEADVVIIGSGITGTSAARFLAEDDRAKGRSVVLLEAREACWGATGRNGGHCQVLPVARDIDVTRFEVLNYNAVRSYIETNNIACEWRSLAGTRAYFDAAAFAVANDEVKALKEKDPELGKLVEIVTDKEKLAAIRIPKAVGATLTFSAASLWPYKLVTFILEKLVKEGKLNLQTNTPVHRVSFSEDEDAEFPNTLHTSRGSIRAKKLIVATNGYSSAILPPFADLIVPVRGEMSALLPPKGAPRLPNSYGLCGQPGQPAHNDDYLNQRPYEGVPNPAGHYMFGGGEGGGKHEYIGVWDDSAIDEGMAAWLRKTLLQSCDLGGETEGLDELTATHQWTGIMGYSRDNVPWVGKVPGLRAAYISAGYTGHGMPNGTLCGKAVVDLLLSEEAGLDPGAARDKVVKDVGLPRSYLVTDERLTAARALPTVHEAEAMGAIGNHARQAQEMAEKGASAAAAHL